MNGITYREYHPADLEVLREIMVEAFDGTSIDQNMENLFGEINGRNWQWRKGRALDVDVERDPGGIIVVEREGEVVGFLSCWMDQGTGIGHIPHIGLRAHCRGQGVGRTLIHMALDRFRAAGLSHAKIDCLEQNAVGNYLYPSCGFQEVARQVHYVTALNSPQ